MNQNDQKKTSAETEDPARVLRRCFFLDEEIKSLRTEQSQLEAELSSLTGVDYGRPVVKSSGGRGSVEQLAISVADRKAKIAAKIGRLMAAKQQARELIETLPEGAERNVLVQRYVLLFSWEQIAVNLGYSYRHVIRLHGEGLRKLREVG